MNIADRVISNLRNMMGSYENMKDLKDFKFENGINLVATLSHLEEKQKSSLKKLKPGGNDLLGKRINPYSKDEDSTEFFYLSKKPQVSSIHSAVPNPQAFTSPEMMDLVEYNGDENDALKISSFIRIENILNFLKIRKQKNEDESDDYILSSNDYAILDFLKNDECILLSEADKWLSQELANYSYHTGSHNRYFAILNEILQIISSPNTLEILFTIKLNSDLLMKFFEHIPLINENVFLCLKVIIELLQEKASEFLTIDRLLDCYQDLLDKFNGQIKAVTRGIRYLMDLGLKETIKLVRYKYYPHPSFTNIIEEFMQQDIESLKSPLEEKDNDNYIKHLLAFAHRDLGYLQRMFDSFPMFNERAKKLLLEKIDRFYGSRFKALDPQEIPIISALFSENEQPHELLEKLASYLKLYLPLLGLAQEDQSTIEEMLKAYQRRKRVDFFCTLILGDEEPKIDGIINNLIQEDILGDVLVHLHRLAIHNDKNVVRIRNIIREKILDQIPHQRIMGCLEEICQPLFAGQLSPLSGVTLLLVYSKTQKADDSINKQDVYNELLDRFESLLKNGALEHPDLKPALLKFLSFQQPFSDRAINLIQNYIPLTTLETEGNERLKTNLELARQKNLL